MLFRSESILPSLVPPFIENPVVSNITENSATISFRTNVKSYPLVSYASALNFDATKENPYETEVSDMSEKKTVHTLNLIGLSPNTEYHLMAKAFSLPQVVGKSNDIVFMTAASKISGSVVEIKKDSFVVVWNTNEPTTSIVEYKNLNNGLIARVIDETRINSHSIKVENLLPGTSYEINISGINSKGNLVENNSNITVRTLTDTTAPIISNLKVESSLVSGRTDRVQTVVSWQTDEPSTSVVYFEEGSISSNNLPKEKQGNQELTKNHVVILSSLKTGSVYRFTVESTDEAENTIRPDVRTIVTPKQAESIFDIIFKNFDNTFDFVNNIN